MKTTEPLREEHRELLPRLEALRLTGEAAASAPAEIVLTAIDNDLAFLRGHLLPHAIAEEAALYPTVEEVMHAPGATATMTRDHEEVGQLIDELGRLRARLSGHRLSGEERRELQRLTFGLYAVLKLHFAKEEEIYLPLLDEALSDSAAREMFERMGKAAANAGA